MGQTHPLIINLCLISSLSRLLVHKMPSGAISYPRAGSDPVFNYIAPNTTITDGTPATGGVI